MNYLPKNYLNINYYFKKYLNELPEPPLHPATRKPIGPEDLAPLFPMELIKQEVSLEEFVEIPDEVREIYKLYRATPLIRAKRLEKALTTPAKIFYKHEGLTLTQSHKINTAIAQAYYNAQEGVKRLTTETGAGQWGSALSMACKFFGLKCLVYMVRISFDQKPYRKTLMKLFGAEVISSPSKTTRMGKQFLAKDPNTHGSLGMAIAESIEVAAKDEETKYSLGSVLNHVLLHQTVIGQEVREQLKDMKVKPDVMIGCCGGGSNMAGFSYPMMAEKLKGKLESCRFVGVEPKSCASMTKGKYGYDFGDAGKQTPLLKMESLGCEFVPPPFHAGGLRYHGIAPSLAFAHQKGLMETRIYDQVQAFKAAQVFSGAEGVVVAPETAHAVAATIDEARRCKRQGKEEVIVFNLSGQGLLDLAGYEDFLEGRLKK